MAFVQGSGRWEAGRYLVFPGAASLFVGIRSALGDGSDAWGIPLGAFLVVIGVIVFVLAHRRRRRTQHGKGAGTLPGTDHDRLTRP